MSEIEYRTAVETWPGVDLVVRAVATDAADPLAGLRFSGYAAVFNSPSEPMPGKRGTFRETIAPSAFTKTLAESGSSLRMFWNHNSDIALASTKASGEAGHLSVATDGIGLRVDATFLPEHRSYAASVAAGVADSMSFGFTPVRAPFSEDGKTRTLDEVRLHEVSIISGWPAYTATSAHVRALAEAVDVEPDILADAFAALRDPERRLAPEQRDLLVHLVNTRSDMPVVGARLAAKRELFAAKAVTR